MSGECGGGDGGGCRRCPGGPVTWCGHPGGQVGGGEGRWPGDTGRTFKPMVGNSHL